MGDFFMLGFRHRTNLKATRTSSESGSFRVNPLIEATFGLLVAGCAAFGACRKPTEASVPTTKLVSKISDLRHGIKPDELYHADLKVSITNTANEKPAPGTVWSYSLCTEIPRPSCFNGGAGGDLSSLSAGQTSTTELHVKGMGKAEVCDDKGGNCKSIRGTPTVFHVTISEGGKEIEQKHSLPKVGDYPGN
ncbi:hypothetical protein HZC07_04940 [Candidatus Micrarchaeota archaeon]|nr:hypothetical protein [Candidatus Micrarchaeota archaeon]